jgi:hypothetical protein
MKTSINIKALRPLFFVLPFLFCIAGENPVQAQTTLDSTTVYITDSGTKYHKRGCRYLSKSKYSRKLSEAKAQGYSACKVCKPSSSNKSNTSSYTPSSPKKTVSNASPTSSSQCTGKTQSGTRCKRKTSDSSGKCYQHR